MKKKLALVVSALGIVAAGVIAVAHETQQTAKKEAVAKQEAAAKQEGAVKQESAATQHDHGAAEHAAGKSMTVTGEVLDLACYMAHEGKGEKHKSCAQACIKGGAPIGVLTADGQVYLLVEDHSAKQPYETLKTKAAEQAKVTGTLQERGGLRALVVASVQ